MGLAQGLGYLCPALPHSLPRVNQLIPFDSHLTVCYDGSMKYTQFKDVPQYMGDAGYMVHADMEWMPRQLYRWYSRDGSIVDFSDEDAFAWRIPVADFQRGHVWTEAQQVAFIEHMLRGGDGGILRFNQPGWMGDWKGDMEVVDGLQRIQAVLLFQSNEIRAFGSLRREYTDHTRLMRARFVLQVNNLKTRAEVLRWYLELNASGTPHTEAELDRVRAMMGE